MNGKIIQQDITLLAYRMLKIRECLMSLEEKEHLETGTEMEITGTLIVYIAQLLTIEDC
jgi:hypothetical protein